MDFSQQKETLFNAAAIGGLYRICPQAWQALNDARTWAELAEIKALYAAAMREAGVPF